MYNDELSIIMGKKGNRKSYKIERKVDMPLALQTDKKKIAN